MEWIHLCSILACVQVVVDAFDSSVLVSNCATKVYDFGTVPEKALHDIVIPLQVGTHC